MKENLKSRMKKAAAVFKKNASVESEGWLVDNYYILMQAAKEAEKGCGAASKKIKGPDILPGLFDTCVKICKNGVLPDEDTIIKAFDGKANGLAADYLPLCFTCALVDFAAKGTAKESNRNFLANAVTSLRRMAETDFEFISESISRVERILRDDPAGIYPKMDEKSKSYYRKNIAKAAAKSGLSEEKLAERILSLSKKKNVHTGEFLKAEKRYIRGRSMLIMQNIMPLVVCVAAGVLLENFLLAVLLFYPLRELFLHSVESVFLLSVEPRRMLRLKSDDESVITCKVMITVSTLMPEPEKATELGEHLEMIFLSNRTKGTTVCCLADFKSAFSPSMPEDDVDVKAMAEVIEKLNKKYQGGFILAVRPRVYSETQDEFTGKERKRGAITELVKAIKGEEKGFYGFYGDKSKLRETKYIFALDSDTVPEFDAVRELVSIAEHPLNRPVIDKKAGRVTDGYGIIVPCAVSKLESENSTVFADIFSASGNGGFYEKIFNEKYHDLFGEGVFCGKGLIDVEAYNAFMMSGFPKETILSHDIIESGYLRAGFACDVTVSESVPKSVKSYFTRLHRWIRGDWQNFGFIFGNNPLNFLSRYKLFDNLLRSLSKPVCVMLLIVSLFLNGYNGIILAVAAVSAIVLPELKSACGYIRKNGLSALTRVYYSDNMPEALLAFSRAFTAFALAVHESYVSIDAISRSLWRILVSKKNLLEWVPAASAENRGKKIYEILSCLPSVAVSAVLFIFGTQFHRFAAIIFLFDIVLTLNVSKKTIRKRKELSPSERETLLSYVSAMWKYFDELCNEENNFLPPDNIQLAPVRAQAHRTSPTDIGMMLVSFLAARDFGFITSQELYLRLSLSLKSIEKLEKYKGNLLNWYSTEDLLPLNPVFVSSVDSGNFLCCLTVLKEGLKEYAGECAPLVEIIARVLKIIKETDLSVLYSRKRGLFYTGINPETEEKSTSYYDLYMSEARLTSYFAIAHRQIPKNHWGNLGRIAVSEGRHSGLVSWTGTMFEYFMPFLFMPAPRGSVFYESLRFCFSVQRRRAGKLPFGISESGFYAFDAGLNYQYKAHGVQKLGLSRGLDKETVISPYSSFLTLGIAPSISLANLKRLEKMGMCGKYGFFEAADFTQSRVKTRFSAVKSFMSHHLGMSIMSTANVLKSDCMQKRFMRDSHMKGARMLNFEKDSGNSTVFEDIYRNEVPLKAEKSKLSQGIYKNPSVINPEAAVYSNGRLSLCVTDSSTGFVSFDGMDVTVRSADLISRPQGIFVVFRNEELVLSNAPFLSSQTAKNVAEFGKSEVTFVSSDRNVSLKVSVSVPKNENAVIVKIKVSNSASRKPVKGKLFVYFEPCLSKNTDFTSHPAYSKLFISNRWSSENSCGVFSRNTGNKAESVSMVAGFRKNNSMRFEFSRENVLSRPEGIFSLGEKGDFSGETGSTDCCCAFVGETEVLSREETETEMILSVGESEKEALNTFARVKAAKATDFSENIFGEDSLLLATARKILPELLRTENRILYESSDKSFNAEIEDLWSFGISGDLPIILIKINSVHEIGNWVEYVRINKKLRMCGIDSDLVFVYSEKDVYNAEISNTLKKMLAQEKSELMLGVKGGIHTVNLTAFPPEKAKFLEKISSCTAGSDNREEKSEKHMFKPLKTVMKADGINFKKISDGVKQYKFTNGEIMVKNTPQTVDIPWNMVYANQSFGTLVSDKALGFTWALNSRQNKLTPWYNDVCSDNRGELLLMKYDGVFYDIIALSDAVFTPEKAVWNSGCCGFDFRVSVQVPKRGMAKKITAEIRNNSENPKEFELMYFTLPVLGASREERKFFSAKTIEKGAVIRNESPDFRGYFALQCNSKADFVCFSRKDFYEGKLDSRKLVSDDCCLAVGRKISVAAGGKINMNFYLSWATDEFAAEKLPFVSDYSPRNLNAYVLQSKNDDLNLFFNSFLYSQVLQTRFYARTGFYQCSGAFGFRDQLQDCLALIDFEPETVKAHLIRCAAVQFKEGDVLHWWHIGLKKSQIIRGVRTKCSDDMLWLPFVCCEYVKRTGDFEVLDIKIPYISGEKLAPGENERFINPKRTSETATLLEHCIKAVERAANFGENGLPLIGSCDWNDAFNKMGTDTAGESVWAGMFLIVVCRKMSDLCNHSGEAKRSEQFSLIADRLKNIIEEKFWFNDHYARAVLKDGSVMGKGDGFLDILPQAFSVFAGLKNSEIAVKTALRELCDEKNRVVRLLKPPFFVSDFEKTGYISLYPRGVRENGGQYTHAAVWLAMALFNLGEKEDGEKVLDLINPTGYYRNEKNGKNYRGEPYVLAGDVYYGKNTTGRAGWTHFTGAAGWFYRCVVENYSDYLTPKFKELKTDKKSNCKVFEVYKTEKNAERMQK